ncbi:finger CW-type PWWP domain 2 isoform X1 [Octopus vulgaris]|uniref:Finger CW-type PWWP domain 2 isoform X1 n=1 Tax=Octopus vulgaris TaxID=6645 RepID=A0AA36BWS4_OCTVU|nr:finger CW-type PWWP domain 2 isoform X1 [Octopus vulgaris]
MIMIVFMVYGGIDKDHEDQSGYYSTVNCEHMDLQKVVTRFWKKTVQINITFLSLTLSLGSDGQYNKHLSDTWIQCDNCLKWRRVSKQEVHRWCDDDKKWICKFNKDQTKNNCNIEEDNFESIEETMWKKGIVFVYPYLTPGDMVMAIMAGYCCPKIFENLNNELQEQILNLLPAAEKSSENVAWSDAPIVKNSSKNDKDSGLKLRRQLSLKGLEEKEIIGMSWIQCDSCLKWRCVSKQEVRRWCDDDKKWICKFNKDQTKNNCNIEEDNFESIEKTMWKKGIVFVYPYLTPGDMVMAIMAGYCWWPAVVSFDPFYNTYVEYQEEEQRKHKDMEEIVVDSYHVEFLGTPHSHAWISSSCIHLLDSNPQSLVSKRYMPKSKGHKSTFRGNSIQGALKEAEIFQKLSKSVRLKRCVFNYTGSEHNTKIGNNNINNNRAMTSSTRKGEHSFYDRPILEFSCDDPKLSRLTQVTAPVVTTTAAVTVAAKFQDAGAQESYTHCSHSLVKRQHFFDSEENIVSEYIESSSVGSVISDTPAILEHFKLVDQYNISYQFEYEIFQETENKVRANLRDYIDPSSYRTPDTDYQILLGDITSIENFTTYTEGERDFTCIQIIDSVFYCKSSIIIM